MQRLSVPGGLVFCIMFEFLPNHISANLHCQVLLNLRKALLNQHNRDL